MKKLFLLLFSCCLVWPVFAQNAKPFCSSMDPKVTVRARFCNPKYNSQYSRAEFLKKANVAKSDPHLLSERVTGLTVGSLDPTLRVAPSLERKSGQMCVTLKEIDVELSCPALTVYIDKKYAPSSCEYQVVRKHENYHVAVWQQAPTFFKKDVEKALHNVLKQMSPKIVHSQKEVDEAADQMRQTVYQTIKSVHENIIRKIKEKHAAIDTTEIYRETTEMCHNW